MYQSVIVAATDLQWSFRLALTSSYSLCLRPRQDFPLDAYLEKESKTP